MIPSYDQIFLAPLCAAFIALGKKDLVRRANGHQPARRDKKVDLRAATHDDILGSEIVLALLTTKDRDTMPNPNVMYEVGYAVHAERKVLLLRHRGSCARPIMCPESLEVPYSSNTELALALFFGMGGTQADLKTYWGHTAHVST